MLKTSSPAISTDAFVIVDPMKRTFSLPVNYSRSTSDVSGEISQKKSINIQYSLKELEDTTMEISSFDFSESMIQKLKERSGASSSFVAVSAHFWRSLMKARQVPNKDSVYFELVADGRERLQLILGTSCP